MQEIRWGILGCGWIANTFATSLKALETGRLVAGASRTPGRARDFAEKHDLDRYYSTYEALVSDPDIDAVYVATTHNFHYENVKLCLGHNKHVLCEKPFTVNAEQSRDLISRVHGKDLFMMEALWTRFLPAILKLQQLLDEQVIGDVQTIYCNFCLGMDVPPEHRLRNIDLAGGALLDLGIYPISMADIVFGRKPDHILTSATMDRITGVDEHSYYLFEYDSGQKAVLSASASQAAPFEATICGTKGYIRVPHFLGASELQIHLNECEPEILHFPYGEGENFKYEIAHAMESIAAGKRESDIMPLSKTLEVMDTMDTLRARWGLVYPDEAS